jgi:peptidoglycan/xylan/chitin deacetylase (PgdA/CDA1 family)
MLFPLIGVGVGAVAAGSAFAYQAKFPTAQWFGRAFVGLPPGARQLALTYDDGPSDPHTLRLLDVLARHGARATFFLIGRFVEQRPDIVREIVKQGHAIGNHTFSHAHLIFTSDTETLTQLKRCQQAIEDAMGRSPKLFRPPFGGRRPGTLQVVRSLGLEPIMWNIAGYDWNGAPAEKIVRRISRRIRGGDVILLHDGGHKAMGADRAETVKATDALLQRYVVDGFEFASILEMMGKAGVRPQTADVGPADLRPQN